LRTREKKKQMFKLLLSLYLAICYLANELNAQIPIPQVGSCANSPIISDFDAAKVI
jgi:hypothetical protein